jgi:hypothetical protein
MTTTLADTWGVNEQQFWLRARVPDPVLGVPSSDRHLFKQWVDKLLENATEFSLVEQSDKQK